MSGDSHQHSTDTGTDPLKGWDKNAFWYPTLDKRGALLGLFWVLFLLHFDSLFGFHTSSTLVFGWWPINMVYHVGMGVLHVGFLYLLYLNWPDPAEEDIEQEVVRGEPKAHVAEPAEGD